MEAKIKEIIHERLVKSNFIRIKEGGGMYEISEKGEIRSLHRPNKILKYLYNPAPRKFPFVGLRENGESKHYGVAKLMKKYHPFFYNKWLFLQRLNNVKSTSTQPTDKEIRDFVAENINPHETNTIEVFTELLEIWLRDNYQQPQKADWDKVKALIRNKYSDRLFNYPVLSEFIDNIVELIKSQLKQDDGVKECCSNPALKIGGIPEHRFCSNCGADWKVNPNTEQKKQTNTK